MDNEDRDHFKTIANPLAPPPDGSGKPPSGGNTVSALDPSYCLSRTKVLFSCYRKDEAHDPETYCSAVAATLSEFPRQVVEYVTDPRTGLPSRSKFLPNVAEVRAACVTEAERLKLRAGPKIVFTMTELPPRPAGDLFVSIDAPRYVEMSELLNKQPELARRERGGVWVPHGWYERRTVSLDTEECRIAASRFHFERACREDGIDPSRNISPSLLKNIGEKNADRDLG